MLDVVCLCCVLQDWTNIQHHTIIPSYQVKTRIQPHLHPHPVAYLKAGGWGRVIASDKGEVEEGLGTAGSILDTVQP